MKKLKGFAAYAFTGLAITGTLLLSSCGSSTTAEPASEPSSAAAQSVPVITDTADILTDQEEQELTQRISDLEQEHNSPLTQIFIIDDSSKTNFAAEVNQKLTEQESNFQEQGVIIGINLGSKSAYIARGSVASQNLTNEEASYIVDKAILPYVTAEDYNGAMTNALDGVYQLSHNNTTADSSRGSASASPTATS
ncbi:TPM domain-containing protein [Rothia nasimurium]|uniref:TPM domain-containing protein n=1 Tax=Rothia nasimurium TaxID=85336 RepID=UPI001F2B0631|nr:TPM domain-containing protein [Rothia nasimurium]